ncbi:MAG TPA: helix-turn-helix domain-containing protein [Candidatus Faecaligallichristensenella faecipullorum]|nr:helix-turn-helix domain-containing protein [Candidatus Faecaligallichristensenella faecipullorum]
MKAQNQPFTRRQIMLKNQYEIYRYHDAHLSEVALHHHDFYEVYFFCAGRVEYAVEGRCYALLPGDILLISPQELHQPIFPEPGEAYERLVLWISRGYLREIAPEAALEQCFNGPGRERENLLRLEAARSARLFDLADALAGESQRPAFGSEAMAKALLTQLMVELGRAQMSAGSPPVKRSDLVDGVARYINAHLDQPLSLERLAETAFVSKYHLSHEFKKQMGSSVYHYILQRRLMGVRERLRAGKNPSEVYKQFGFNDYANFYRAFRAEYGITPRAYVEGLEKE